MSDKPGRAAAEEDDILRGTTLRVYRYIYKAGGGPVGIHDTQRALGLSSPSLAEYHIKKLARAGLIQERGNGYVVDRVIFRNLIRIRRTLIPLQTTYATFFLSTLVVLVTILRPAVVTSIFAFALAVNLAAVAISLYEAIKTLSATSG